MRKDSFRYKPQIFRQGLILVLIPLSLGSCVFALFIQLCNSASAISQAEQTQSHLLEHYNLAFNQWSQASANLIARAFAGEKSYDAYCENYLNALASELDELRVLAAKTNQTAKVRQLEVLCNESLLELKKLPKASDAAGSANSMQSMPGICTKIYALPAKVKSMLEREHKRLKIVRKKEDKQAALMKNIAYLCIFSNIFVAILLVFSFSRRITTRLQLVTQNAALLPEMQKLNLSLSGNDELSYLDYVLKESSENLRAAAEHRRAIFGMVAHDMRSPLNAAQLCLEVISELFTGPYQNDSDKDLSLAQAKMAGILTHVNELLSLEKNEQASGGGGESTLLPEADPETGKKDLELTEKIRFEGLSQLNAGKTVHLPQRAVAFLHQLFFSPRIFHKGLWLVLFPLSIQTVFMMILNHELSVSESFLAKQRQQADFLQSMNTILLDSLRATTSNAIYMVAYEQALKERVLHNYELVKTGLDKVEEVTPVESEWKGVIKSWRKLERQIVAGLKTESKHGIEDLSIAAMKKRIRALRPIQKKAVQIGNSATSIYRRESANLAVLEQAQIDSSKNLINILSWGLLVNLLIAMGMLWSFNNDISRRLMKVVDNASKLGSAEP
ncbi:MAG: hypothetical protein K2X27_14695, partial [Candidatus Obscuribacterales bacterium]|nr:hypothetical protein [Candidatus Obscuribacterales bacterium]